jgi:hypothetical protein
VKICTEDTIRMVTHNDIQKEDIDFVLARVGTAVKGKKK